MSSQASGRYANGTQWLLMLSAVAMLVLACGWVVAAASVHRAVLSSVLLGFSCYMVVALVGHDAAHQSLSRNHAVNRIALFLSFAIIGVSGYLWGRRHVRIHHQAPNVVGNGIDGDRSIIVRFHSGQEWKPWHRLQWLYAPALYFFVLPGLAWYGDFIHLRRELRRTGRRFLMVSEFVLTKIVHASFAFLAPYLYFGLSPLMIGACYLAASMAASFLFVIVNVGTHLNVHAEMVHPEESNGIRHDWAAHQVMTTVDWSPESRIACILTGGANAHLAHHLFPHAAHCHNTRLTQLVAAAAAAHDVDRNVISFREMLAGHLALLRKFSKPPRA